MQDCQDGTYTAPISLEKVGLISISAMISGQPLGLPVTLRVLPAQLHSLELISPQNPQTVAGTPLTSSVQEHFISPAYVFLVCCLLNLSLCSIPCLKKIMQGV